MTWARGRDDVRRLIDEGEVEIVEVRTGVTTVEATRALDIAR